MGIVPDAIIPAEIDETPSDAETPRACARRLAAAKAATVKIEPDALVLAADTVVAVGRRMLGKPADSDEARRFLALLSGRRHRVITAIALRLPDGIRERSVETAVRFKQLTAAEIDDYIASGEWQGKAGGYAIQGRAGGLIPWIGGSYSNVVGLPLTETLALLASGGVRPHAPA